MNDSILWFSFRQSHYASAKLKLLFARCYYIINKQKQTAKSKVTIFHTHTALQSEFEEKKICAINKIKCTPIFK